MASTSTATTVKVETDDDDAAMTTLDSPLSTSAPTLAASPTDVFFRPGLWAWQRVSRYTLRSVVGKGAYGMVFSARDASTGMSVVIKRISRVFESVATTKRVIRELKIHRCIQDRIPGCVVRMTDVLMPSDASPSFDDVFIVMERMDCDLSVVRRSLTDAQCAYLTYQLFRALDGMHRCGLVHRDVKPQNVLVNKDCTLRLCDFGMSRWTTGHAKDGYMWSDYVTTRWYRSPELCAPISGAYTTASDIWSAGCIFAELLGGRAVFPGRDSVHQLALIADLIGPPPETLLASVRDPMARSNLNRRLSRSGSSDMIDYKFAMVSPVARDLLRALLVYDPASRISAKAAMEHPYFSHIHPKMPATTPYVSSWDDKDFTFDMIGITTKEARMLLHTEMLISSSLLASTKSSQPSP